jgi:hypothetical protein
MHAEQANQRAVQTSGLVTKEVLHQSGGLGGGRDRI